MSNPPASPNSKPAAPPASDAVVDQWFVETFHGLPIPTDLFNRFNAARDELKRRLARAQE